MVSWFFEQENSANVTVNSTVSMIPYESELHIHGSINEL